MRVGRKQGVRIGCGDKGGWGEGGKDFFAQMIEKDSGQCMPQSHRRERSCRVCPKIRDSQSFPPLWKRAMLIIICVS